MFKRFALILMMFTVVFASQASKNDDGAILDSLMSRKFRTAQAYTNAGRYIDAFKDWVDYLDWAQKNPAKADNKHLMVCYLALATIHFNFQDYESSLDFNRRGLELSKAGKETDGSIRFLNNMVGCYSELDKFDEATKCNDSILLLSKGSRNSVMYLFNYTFNKGFIAKKRKNYRQALSHLRDALGVIDRNHLDTAKRAFPYSEIYSVYDLMGRPDSALVYLLKYQQYANKPHLQKDCYKELMKTYAKLGDNANTLRCQEMYFRLADSVLNEREFMEIRNYHQTRVNEEREGHILALEMSIKFRNLIIIASVTALLLLVVIAWLIWRQKRRLHVAYTDLFERNRELLEMQDRLVEQRRLLNPTNRPKPEAVVVDRPEPDDKDVDSSLLDRIIDVFDNTTEYLNPEFSLQTLAKMVESNTKYVSQAINDGLKKNFRTMVNEYRIKEAQRRMLDKSYSNYTIHAIAESVGYKSSTNFIASFKKATGITPSIYLKISREEAGRI